MKGIKRSKRNKKLLNNTSKVVTDVSTIKTKMRANSMGVDEKDINLKDKSLIKRKMGRLTTKVILILLLSIIFCVIISSRRSYGRRIRKE